MSSSKGATDDDTNIMDNGVVIDSSTCMPVLGDMWLLSNHGKDTTNPWLNLMADTQTTGSSTMIRSSRDVHILDNANNRSISSMHHHVKDAYRSSSDGPQLDHNRCIGPGARKWSIIVTAPISRKVLLFGGYGHLDRCSNSTATSSGGRGAANGDYHRSDAVHRISSSSDIGCLNDFYEFNATVAVAMALQRTIIRNGTTNDTIKSSNHADGSSPWKKLAALKVCAIYLYNLVIAL